MNEIKILNYVINRLSNIRSAADADTLVVELTTVRSTLTVVPCYCVDKIIDALFCGVFDDAE